MTCKWLEICELRELEDERKIPSKWRKEYCETEDNWKKCKRFQMEKRGESHDNILPNGEKLKC